MSDTIRYRQQRRAPRAPRRPGFSASLGPSVLVAAGIVYLAIAGSDGRLSVSALGADPNCRIKANISLSGEHIYHLPGQESYDATQIRHLRGERWFCTEAEARSSGWRRAYR